MQRVPAGQDRLVVEQAVGGMFAAEQAERHPRLGGEEGEERQPPQGMIAWSSGGGAPFGGGSWGSMKVGW